MLRPVLASLGEEAIYPIFLKHVPHSLRKVEGRDEGQSWVSVDGKGKKEGHKDSCLQVNLVLLSPLGPS